VSATAQFCLYGAERLRQLDYPSIHTYVGTAFAPFGWGPLPQVGVQFLHSPGPHSVPPCTASPAIMLVIPGAMEAGPGSALFWGSLAFALIVAGAAAFPVNWWLIAHGRGHAVVHDHHSQGH
jgi:hypothetical protein